MLARERMPARGIRCMSRGSAGEASLATGRRGRRATCAAPTAPILLAHDVLEGKTQRRPPVHRELVWRRQSLRRPARVPWCSNRRPPAASRSSSLPRSTMAYRPESAICSCGVSSNPSSMAQGPQHRLERVRCPTVGVLRHPTDLAEAPGPAARAAAADSSARVTSRAAGPSRPRRGLVERRVLGRSRAPSAAVSSPRDGPRPVGGRPVREVTPIRWPARSRRFRGMVTHADPAHL